jgi:hypothetical protein
MPFSNCSTRSHAALTHPSQRAGAFLGFALHLAAYVVGVAVMVGINLVFWSGYFWAIWPIMGWGIGVFSHGSGVARMVFHALAREGTAGAPGRPVSSSPGMATVTLSEEEWQRTVRRLEHLEAIVTSEAWDDRPGPGLSDG